MKATKSYLLKLMLLVCLLFGIMSVSAGAATAVYTTDDGLYTFTLNAGKEATIRSYKGISSTLSIPASITYKEKPYNVVGIGNGQVSILPSATSGQIKKVIIPSSIREIAANAFISSSKLTSVVIGSGVESIGDSAFQECKVLASVDFSSAANLKTIGDGAFLFNIALTTLDLGASKVTSIGDSAFMGCTKLTTVTLSDTLTSLGENAFKDCSVLEKVTSKTSPVTKTPYCGLTTFDNYLPAALENLASYAFYGTALKESLYIPPRATTVHEGAFQNCKGLKTIYCASGVKTIESVAFKNCTALAILFLPKTVDGIADDAFAGNAITNSRTKLYVFEGSYADEFLNGTKLYNASTFKYISPLSYSGDIELTPDKVTIWAGLPVDINITYKSVMTEEMANVVEWSANNSAIQFAKKNQTEATVTSIKAGSGYQVKASISGTDADATANIKVLPAPTSVSIRKKGGTKAYATFNIKNSVFELYAYTLPEQDAPDSVWEVSDDTIATIDQNGKLIFKKEGKVKVTVTTYNSKTASCYVNFAPSSANDEILDNPKKPVVAVYKGTTPVYFKKSSVTLSPTMKFASSNTDVATVTDSSGKITVKGVGTATIIGVDLAVTPAKKVTFDVVVVAPKSTLATPCYKKVTAGHKIIWKRQAKVNGYRLHYKLKSTSKWSHIDITKGAKRNYYVFDSLKKNKEYEICVQSFITYKGVKYFSEKSAIGTFKAK